MNTMLAKLASSMYVQLLSSATGTAMLGDIKNMLQGGMTFLGGAMIVFGGITIGINVHGTAQGNGGAISSGVAILIGGAIIMASAIYFGTLDVSWVGGH